MKKRYYYIFLLSLLWSCKTGKLTVLADVSGELHEVSAIETVPNSNLYWVIEDAGNSNTIYGLNTKGTIQKSVTIDNIDNKDWEDLTSDISGHLYIGDFGNNNKKRKLFSIYKIDLHDILADKTQAKSIQFSLPDHIKSKDFESFFLWNDTFYIFSKDHKKCFLFKVPNAIGKHTAKFISEHKFDKKDNKITSADISSDGQTVVLLTHNKLWKLTKFEGENFFSGRIESLAFDHNSQKEGICFKNKNEVLITEESEQANSSNLYLFKLD